MELGRGRDAHERTRPRPRLRRTSPRRGWRRRARAWSVEVKGEREWGGRCCATLEREESRRVEKGQGRETAWAEASEVANQARTKKRAERSRGEVGARVGGRGCEAVTAKAQTRAGLAERRRWGPRGRGDHRRLRQCQREGLAFLERENKKQSVWPAAVNGGRWAPASATDQQAAGRDGAQHAMGKGWGERHVCSSRGRCDPFCDLVLPAQARVMATAVGDDLGWALLRVRGLRSELLDVM